MVAPDMNGEGYEWMRDSMVRSMDGNYVYNHGPGSASLQIMLELVQETLPSWDLLDQKPSVGQAPPRENATVPSSQGGGLGGIFGAPARPTTERGAAAGDFGGPSNADRI